MKYPEERLKLKIDQLVGREGPLLKMRQKWKNSI
jgi:hypothetical protein